MDQPSIYFQYMPDKDGLMALQSLQNNLSLAGIDGRPVRPANIHLTILHIGYTEEVFAQLRSVVADLSRDHFNTALLGLVRTAHTILPQTITVQAKQWNYFGPAHNVLTVSVQPPDESLSQIHTEIHQAAEQFLAECGIPDTVLLPHHPRALQLHGDFRPHISLIKGLAPGTRVVIPLPELTLRMMRYPLPDIT